MSERREEGRRPVHDRALLLHGPKRNEVLTLREVLPRKAALSKAGVNS